jgi:hypothetical protein
MCPLRVDPSMQGQGIPLNKCTNLMVWFGTANCETVELGSTYRLMRWWAEYLACAEMFVWCIYCVLVPSILNEKMYCAIIKLMNPIEQI